MVNEHNQYVGLASPKLERRCSRYVLICIGMCLVLIGACNTEEQSSGPEFTASEQKYYGFALVSQGEERVRVFEGTQSGNLFVIPNQVIPPLTVSLLDINGEIIQNPDDSLLVLLTLEPSDRAIITPTVLPDPKSGWNIALDGLRLGLVKLHCDCIPARLCAEASIEIQVVG